MTPPSFKGDAVGCPRMSAFSSAYPSLRDLAARLPSFEVLRRLSSGDDSAIYLARQKTLDRLVRIRVLRETESEDGALERLRLRARLQHPLVTAVYDCGRMAGGPLYLVTEHVEGVPLAEVVAAGRLKPKQAYAPALQLCEALQAVHAHGLVHGCLSARSVLWLTGDQIKLTGAGMALTAAGERTWLQAPAGGIAGDLHALGHTLHVLFTGEEPGSDGRVARDLPPSFAQVLRRCLDPRTSQPFTRADEVRAALIAAVQAGRPAPAPLPAGTPPRPPGPPAPRQRRGPSPLQRLDAFLWNGLKVGLHLTITVVSLGSLLLLYHFKDRIVIEERIERPGALPPRTTAAEPPIPASVMGALPAAPTLSVPGPLAKPLQLPTPPPSPLEQLRARYVQSVQAAAQSALDQVRLDVLPHLQRELTLLQSGAEPPDTDEADLPPGLAELRRNYRAARASLQAPAPE